MSEPQSTLEKGAPARREQIRVRFDKLRRSRQQGMFGISEIAGLAASGVMLLAILFSYVYFLVPARARVKATQDERIRLQDRVRLAQEGVNMNASPSATVDEINLSLETFERQTLMQSVRGRMELYGQLNELMRRHTLRNTAGPVYAPLEPIGSAAAAGASKAGNARWQSLYPGVSIAVTVEGQYANLRRFLREIEVSKQFIIVNAVELEGVTDMDTATGATLVSLRLDMATYFQREGVEASADTR
ncbi:MAG: hypothetical protein H7Y30_01765 [Pyrinomonadaceae bacterium]|nr:hypothetical protein [Pyrinomonadaceae bacterium]